MLSPGDLFYTSDLPLYTFHDTHLCRWRMRKAKVSLLAGGSSAMDSRVVAKLLSSVSATGQGDRRRGTMKVLPEGEEGHLCSRCD